VRHGSSWLRLEFGFAKNAALASVAEASLLPADRPDLAVARGAVLPSVATIAEISGS
jgi:hypothetical protein